MILSALTILWQGTEPLPSTREGRVFTLHATNRLLIDLVKAAAHLASRAFGKGFAQDSDMRKIAATKE
jgi:hypothetical protein